MSVPVGRSDRRLGRDLLTFISRKSIPVDGDGESVGWATMFPVTRAARLSVIGLALAAFLFIAGYALIPTRVTGGGGSLRCGTSLHPDTKSEIRHACPAVGRQRLEDTAIATAIFALVPATLIPVHLLIEKRPVLRSLVTVLMVAFWVFGGALTLYYLTGAYPRSGN